MPSFQRYLFILTWCVIFGICAPPHENRKYVVLTLPQKHKKKELKENVTKWQNNQENTGFTHRNSSYQTQGRMQPKTEFLLTIQKKVSVKNHNYEDILTHRDLYLPSFFNTLSFAHMHIVTVATDACKISLSFCPWRVSDTSCTKFCIKNKYRCAEHSDDKGSFAQCMQQKFNAEKAACEMGAGYSGVDVSRLKNCDKDLLCTIKIECLFEYPEFPVMAKDLCDKYEQMSMTPKPTKLSCRELDIMERSLEEGNDWKTRYENNQGGGGWIQNMDISTISPTYSLDPDENNSRHLTLVISSVVVGAAVVLLALGTACWYCRQKPPDESVVEVD